MCLRRADAGVHVAEICKAPEALIVELRKRGDKAIAFARCQIVCVFSNADHAWRRADHFIAITVSCFDPHVAEIGARLSEFPGSKKVDPRAVNRDLQTQRRRERSGGTAAKNKGAAVCCCTGTDFNWWGSLALRTGGVRYPNSTRSRGPRDELRIGGSAIVNLYFNVHLASPSNGVKT
jgi:hypothetical protein